MATKILALLGVVAAVGFGSGGVVQAMPLAGLSTPDAGFVQVYHRGRPHRLHRHPPQRVVVYPRGYAYPDYYATYRGFQDPGFAIRGNMPGCAVDLGYGRWESCDK